MLGRRHLEAVSKVAVYGRRVGGRRPAGTRVSG